VRGERGLISANAVLISDEKIDLSSAGIETIPLAMAKAYLDESNPSVLGAHFTPESQKALLQLLKSEQIKNPNKSFIVYYDQLSSKDLIHINNHLHPTKVLNSSEHMRSPHVFQECFAHYFEQEQNAQLVSLVQEKNEELKKLTADLEEKVESRQKQLEKSLLKNTNAKKTLQVLKLTLMQIYQAASIREIEHGVTFALSKEFGVSAVRIRRPSQSNFSQGQDSPYFYEVSLTIGNKNFGDIFFYRTQKKSFTAQDKRFFNQVAEAVSLSMDRTIQLINSQELKTQWEATFDAISDPICLTDEDYNIQRINAAFLEQTQTEKYQVHIGKKCYASLFGRSTPCEGCQRGQVFQLRNPAQTPKSEVFEVYSNNLGDSQKAIYFQMYRDVTRDLNLQRQVIESAKMAELGTISSSIAHELNNPIGGMLNFVQLMKMDLTGDEDFYNDILEIEKGIIKCKNIVKNLLGFSRKSFNSDIQEVNLVEVVEQAIKITELKTRSIGIQIQFDRDQPEVFLQGRFNLLTHAIRNILQNSQESLIAQRKQDKHFKGRISIVLRERPDEVILEIQDNGEGIEDEILHKIFDPLFTTKDPETNSGLGLTLALQIVKEHNGTITVSTDKDKKLSLVVRFFKSEVQSGPSGF
jgi:two-component system NtrC family sensor kinase